MATNNTSQVQEFFNELSGAMRASIGTGYEANARDNVRRFISHMSPDNRSSGRHSVWPTAAQLLLNSVYPDGRQFAMGVSPLSKIIAYNGGLMGLEYMGFEADQSKARPKYRFTTLTVPSTGPLLLSNAATHVYFLKDVPRDRKDGKLVDELDKLMTEAVATGGAEHQRVVMGALQHGYGDLGVPGRLKKLCVSNAP